MSRSFMIYISASLIFLYYYGTGVVPNGSHVQSKSSLPKIAMHVDAICEFSWILWYAASISIFTIKMHFDGHLRRMDEIM